MRGTFYLMPICGRGRGWDYSQVKRKPINQIVVVVAAPMKARGL